MTARLQGAKVAGAEALESDVVQRHMQSDVVIGDPGAATFTAAIDVAKAQGGGAVVVPPGGLLVGSETFQAHRSQVDPEFPNWAGVHPDAGFRVYSVSRPGKAHSGVFSVVTNGNAAPFNTAIAGDAMALCAWVFKGATGTNPIVAGNIGARYANNNGAIVWGLEIDLNNEGATQAEGSPSGGEGLVLNTGSTYSPDTAIRIRRAAGEGTGPGWLRGMYMDGVRNVGIRIDALTAPGLTPAAPGTIRAFDVRVGGDTQPRWTVNQNGGISWGSGSLAQDCTVYRGGAGNLNCTATFAVDAGKFYAVGPYKVVGDRDTGWVAMTGTADKNTALATGTVTVAQLAERVKALQDALTAHGLLGA